MNGRMKGQKNEYVSVMHVHTSFSDGHSDVEGIAAEAAETGVDIVFITDHSNDDVRKLGKEGWYGDVLVVAGYELNDPRNKNHYLVFDVDECLDGNTGAREYVKEVRRRGGLGFLAHPDERRDAFPEHPPYEWTDWDIDGFDGIEIWNYMSEWMEMLRPGKQFFYLLFPDRAIFGPTEKVLEFWDRAARDRNVVAVGSADAHCHQHPLLWFTVPIFPYRKLFRRIRTHLLTRTGLTRDPAIDRKLVFEALRAGSVYISNYRYGDASGFSFCAGDGETQVGMGEEIPLSPDVTLTARLPLKAKMILICDGETVMVKRGRTLEFVPTRTGCYRVEAGRRGKPWIYSNMIRVV